MTGETDCGSAIQWNTTQQSKKIGVSKATPALRDSLEGLVWFSV